METMTPETEYCGFTADSSLYTISTIQYLTFVFFSKRLHAFQAN
jgi:hypothetical protein